ncbi:hypothetical protein [Sediminitomix flava]|uniref:Calx-beta domain-containing protein n=1 Tax=Sediminitomix flava TaxID=379075 RepID=A0A315Z8M7_SEDFL|nr:hypothetical protein [Sediminitomix flava]PWJ40799.1 hypothetical protein BC781_10458 [Sediminitomix flava]
MALHRITKGLFKYALIIPLMMGMIACEDDSETSLKLAVGFEETSLELKEQASLPVKLPIRITGRNEVSGDVTISYEVQGAGWDSRLRDMNNGQVVLTEEQFVTYVELYSIDNAVLDDDAEFSVAITAVNNGSASLAIGGDYDSQSAMVKILNNDIEGQFNPCTQLGNQIFGSQKAMRFEDTAFGGTYSGDVVIDVEAPDNWDSEDKCTRLKLSGDLINYGGRDDSMEIVINEEDGTVEIPAQYLGEGSFGHIWIKSETPGTYNATEGTIEVKVLYVDSASASDTAETANFAYTATLIVG